MANIDIDRIPQLAQRLAAGGLPDEVIYEVLYNNMSIDSAIDAYTTGGLTEESFVPPKDITWDENDTEKYLSVVNVINEVDEPDVYGTGVGATIEEVVYGIENIPGLMEIAGLVEETIENPDDLDEFEILLDQLDDAMMNDVDDETLDQIMAQIDVAETDPSIDRAMAFQDIASQLLAAETEATYDGLIEEEESEAYQIPPHIDRWPPMPEDPPHTDTTDLSTYQPPLFVDPMMSEMEAMPDNLYKDEGSFAIWDKFFKEQKKEWQSLYVDSRTSLYDRYGPKGPGGPGGYIPAAAQLFGHGLDPGDIDSFTTKGIRETLATARYPGAMAASLFNWLYINTSDGNLSAINAQVGYTDLFGVIRDALTGEGVYESGETAIDYRPSIEQEIDGDKTGILMQMFGTEMTGETGEQKLVWAFPDEDTITYGFGEETTLGGEDGDIETLPGRRYLSSMIEATTTDRDRFDKAFKRIHPRLSIPTYSGIANSLFDDAMVHSYFNTSDPNRIGYTGRTTREVGEDWATSHLISERFGGDEAFFEDFLRNRFKYQQSLFKNVENLSEFLHKHRWSFKGEDYVRLKEEDASLSDSDIDTQLATYIGLDLTKQDDRDEFLRFKAFNPLIHKNRSEMQRSAIGNIKQAAVSALTPVGASSRIRGIIRDSIDNDYDVFTSSGQGSPLSFLKHALSKGRIVSGAGAAFLDQDRWGDYSPVTDPMLRLPGGRFEPMIGR
jgi:hypothetical protein